MQFYFLILLNISIFIFKGFGQLIFELFNLSINFIKNGISLLETLFSKIVNINFLFFDFNK